MLEEMGTVSGPAIDLSNMAEQARDAVSDKPVDEALKAFVSLFRVDVAQLRKSSEKELAQSHSWHRHPR